MSVDSSSHTSFCTGRAELKQIVCCYALWLAYFTVVPCVTKCRGSHIYFVWEAIFFIIAWPIFWELGYAKCKDWNRDRDQVCYMIFRTNVAWWTKCFRERVFLKRKRAVGIESLAKLSLPLEEQKVHGSNKEITITRFDHLQNSLQMMISQKYIFKGHRTALTAFINNCAVMLTTASFSVLP